MNRPDIILADQTLEILQVVEMTDFMMRENYNNDSEKWKDAIFRVLKLRNAAYLWQERNSHDSASQNLIRKLNEDINHTYSAIQSGKPSNEPGQNDSYSDFLHTACSLIKSFHSFTNLFVKEDDIKIDLGDMLAEMKSITQNISKYISKYESDESEKISDSNNGKTTNVDKLVSVESSSSISSVSSTGFRTSGSNEGIATRSLMSTVVPTTKCEECGEAFLILNNNIEYSQSLHSRDKTHRKIIKTKSNELTFSSIKEKLQMGVAGISTKPPRSLSEGDKSNESYENSVQDNIDEDSLRSSLKKELGDQNSVIDILSIKPTPDFFCVVCKCKIPTIAHALEHVNGKAHSKVIASIKLESTTESNATVSKKVEDKSRKSQDVLQVSSRSIPIKKLAL